jgi:hypothetical protein
MPHRYRFRFPLEITWFKFGIVVVIRQPIVRIEAPSISIFLNFLDD